MHQRIVLTASALVLLVVALTSFFSMRITMQEEQGILQEQLLGAARYAAASAQDDATLERVAGLISARVTRMDRNGTILYDSSGQVGYYLDQPDVVAALSNGTGTEISFQGRLAQMQVAVSVLDDDDGTILRITKSQVVFRHGNWGLFAALMMGVLVVCIYLSFALARRIVTPINQISKAAQAIIDGNYNVNLRIDGYAELNQLLRTLQSMNTRLQETVEKLQHKSAELESIIDHMLNGLIAVDGQLHVVQMNNAAKHMLGVTGSVEGKHVLEATGNSRLETILQEAMEHEELITLELPVRAAPRHRLIRLYISPLEHENESIGAVALLEDITEIRNLEQIRTDFAANVTHELKTPLTSIKGFVETLQAGAIENPEMAKRFLDIIAMETDRLSRLINDVLSLSSMESGRVRVPTERLSLGKRAEEVCLMLENSARQKSISLHVDADEEAYIQANDDHVKQLLINLIDNAIKYTLDGGKVNVRVERRGDKVYLHVKDTGIGIAQEHIPRLFERFYRVDKGRSRNMGGTGLGLAIVKHIVMDMNGQIDVQSELNVGTEFTVTLPYAKENASS
ncbi:MAG: two-component system histidine kinase PnpS [Candidatus Spyradocola sp.]|jgi:two-component system phosphate regulon sensor histidine kinase PhoR